MDYEDAVVARRYRETRSLSPAVMTTWLEEIAAAVPMDEVTDVLDLGCGAGRFTVAFADRFDVRVIGADPSAAMLEETGVASKGRRVKLVQTSAESLPLSDGSVDLVFMSMVFHHLTDAPRALDECRRVLSDEGHLAVRLCTLDAIDAVPYMRYFPAARSYREQRLPTREQVQAAVTTRGFESVRHRIVDQPCADDLTAYRVKLEGRAHSDLAAISDEDFEAGLRDMRTAAATSTGPIVEPIDLFIFRAV